MLDFPRWKVWLISLTILVGIFFAIPSLLPASAKERWPSWLPKETISLGLDLAGGSQLLLEADATDASKLHFPSYGENAARLLVEERRVALLGIDTASIDYGPASDFPVHRIAAAANVPGLENVAGLDALPPRGAILFALPMKIAGGSGGPTRVVALVPRGSAGR